MKHLIFIPIALLVTVCTGADKNDPDQHVYWVNSLKVSCVGLGPSECLQVQKGEIIDPTAWKVFHAAIIGFDFEPGYRYKILVKEEKHVPADVPSDGSSIEYRLVRILEKEADKRLKVNSKWVVQSILGKIITAERTEGPGQPPTLEIKVGEMTYSGNDGCNNYFGGIIELDEKIIRFGIGAGTRMACQHMKIPDQFNMTLPKVTSYEVDEQKLQLFDDDGNGLMELMKID